MQDYRGVLNEPEPEWKMESYKRKEHRRSKEAAEINGSAVASTAHKNNLSRLSTLGVRCRCCFLIFSDTSYNRSRNSCWIIFRFCGSIPTVEKKGGRRASARQAFTIFDIFVDWL
jgi:hypothetical protein